MTRPVSLGYLTPAEGAVRASSWLVIPAGHEPLANPSNIENWHYATDLLVERSLSLEEARLRDSAGLSPHDQIRCVITWTSTSTQLQGCSNMSLLRDGVNEVSVPIPGDLLGGALKLRTVA